MCAARGPAPGYVERQVLPKQVRRLVCEQIWASECQAFQRVRQTSGSIRIGLAAHVWQSEGPSEKDLRYRGQLLSLRVVEAEGDLEISLNLRLFVLYVLKPLPARHWRRKLRGGQGVEGRGSGWPLDDLDSASMRVLRTSSQAYEHLAVSPATPQLLQASLRQRQRGAGKAALTRS